MLPLLDTLKQSIWLKITGLAFGCGLLGILVWILITSTLSQSFTAGAFLSCSITLTVAVLAGKAITIYAVKATDFLARAILLVSYENNDIQPPDPASLDANQSILIDLASKVYNLASKITQEPVESPELLFYRSVANLLPLPVVVLNNQQVVVFANEAALRYIELSASDVINRPVFESMNLSFSNITLEQWLSDCSNNSVAANEIWERVRLNLPDEKRKQFDMAAHYSKNDTNGIETVLVLFDRTRIYERDDHDLTFVALAVHELRTPLTVMRGYIEVFEDEISHSLNEEQTTFMHNMGASAEQLTSFVSNILNVARVEENALFLRLKEEKWPDVLKTACRDMELRASVHNKHLVYEIAENLPTVAVDKVSIYEVVSNLIDNAIKYTHTDESITIKTYEKDGMVETTVTDKGVGVAEPLVAHIFDKFYRAHQSKNSVGGTGLGLYLCRSIINAHGGNIWVRSKEGEGSTFGFTLPIYQNVADQLSNKDNNNIIRGAHGWIKNHSFYRE